MSTAAGTALLLVFLIAVPARAAWLAGGTPLSTAPGAQIGVQAAPDTSGGAIVTWEDYRGSTADIYAQRVDARGDALWTAGGIPICTATGNQTQPVIAPDGAGGAIIVWKDNRLPGADIYAQRVSASGTVQWTLNGKAVCTASGTQSLPSVDSDGAGGAMIGWQDQRAGTDDIYVQRLDATGAAVWALNGVAACTSGNNQQGAQVVADGSQGVIVTWFDLRSGTNYDVYAQSVNFFGSPVWTPNGVPVCTDVAYQYNPRLVTDGAGGAIIAWEDTRGAAKDVYIQRVDASGARRWTANGVALCTASYDQGHVRIAADGKGGAICVWFDFRPFPDTDIYAQRVDADGSPLWKIDGLPVCSAVASQDYPSVVGDGEGGAFVAWLDLRSNTLGDLYAQHVDLAGNPYWTPDGVAVTGGQTAMLDAAVVASDCGLMFAWRDYRANFVDGDVYAQRVEIDHGTWGHPEPVLDGVADVPGDQGGYVAVNWQASGRDRFAPRAVGSYSVWRAVDSFGRGPDAPPLDQLVSRAAFRTPDGYYWELVGSQSAHGWSTYSFNAATRADSVSMTPGVEYFVVVAHDEQDSYVAYASDVLSGYSVDNLAPAAPIPFTAQRVGNDVHLSWGPVTDADLRDYTVYRASSSGVTPTPANFLAAVAETSAVDFGAPSTALWYIVTATDVHENQGPASDEASVAGVTGVPGLPPIAGLALLPNRPNPFRGGTELTLGLPVPCDVFVTIHDVAGRTLRRLEAPGRPAGWNRLPFDGRDADGRPLPGGVYFYRVRAAGSTVAGDFVVAR